MTLNTEHAQWLEEIIAESRRLEQVFGVEYRTLEQKYQDYIRSQQAPAEVKPKPRIPLPKL
jgi:hypothetical protein